MIENSGLTDRFRRNTQYRLYETGPLKGVGKSLLLVGVYRRAFDLVRPDGVRISADDKHLIYSPATVQEGIKSGRCTWSGDQLVC